MIPPYLSEDCKSPGEKTLFMRFKDAPGTREWILLHSLGIAKHPTRSEGEIDFVAIVPGEGVLCIEVKSGNVAREDGVWRYGSGHFTETSTVGPFRQAAEAMHALKKYVMRTDPTLGAILFISCVFFTYVDFDEQSAEWHPWQFADRSMLTRHPVSECVRAIFQKAHEHFRGVPSASWYGSSRSRPSIEQSERLAGILRGNFEYFVSPRTIIDEGEKSIRKYTEEQFSALDVILENPRILFKGPAGTGKTFLAVETARRSVVDGKRTLLACYNNLLGNWLAKETATLTRKYPGVLEVGTFHRFMLRLSGKTPPNNTDKEFWVRDLPEIVVDGILSGQIDAPMLDVVVLDEAQDLVSDTYLDVLDLLLAGGLAGGRWIVYGDFERQAIYIRAQLDGGYDVPKGLMVRSPLHFVYPLRINCRNTKPITISIELLCKMLPGYSRVLNSGEGQDVQVHFYNDAEEQGKLLEDHLGILRKAFKTREIIVLSPKEDTSACAGMVAKRNPAAMLMPLRNEGKEGSMTGFATVHAFKGMESPAVILTDIDGIEGERAMSLLYVGMSRARLKLVILMRANCRDRYTNAIRESFISREK